MTLLLIIGLCLCVSVLLALIVPLRVEIDSSRPCACISVLYLVTIRLYPADATGERRRELEIPGKTFRSISQSVNKSTAAGRDLGAKNEEEQNQIVRKATKKPRRINWRRAAVALPRLLRRIHKALDVKEFEAAFDSGDFVLNAQLFALQPWLRAQGFNININFNSDNQLYSRIDLVPARLLFAAIAFGWYLFKPFPSSKQD